MEYVDGFVLPLPTANIEAYRRLAETAAKIWKEHGALAYRECVAEDTVAADMVAFPVLAGCGEGETVVFAYITYKSRAHRDEVNAKVMADPRIQSMCDPDNSPFDFKRMAYGGFSVLVDM